MRPPCFVFSYQTSTCAAILYTQTYCRCTADILFFLQQTARGLPQVRTVRILPLFRIRSLHMMKFFNNSFMVLTCLNIKKYRLATFSEAHTFRTVRCHMGNVQVQSSALLRHISLPPDAKRIGISSVWADTCRLHPAAAYLSCRPAFRNKTLSISL